MRVSFRVGSANHSYELNYPGSDWLDSRIFWIIEEFLRVSPYRFFVAAESIPDYQGGVFVTLTREERDAIDRDRGLLFIPLPDEPAPPWDWDIEALAARARAASLSTVVARRPYSGSDWFLIPVPERWLGGDPNSLFGAGLVARGHRGRVVFAYIFGPWRAPVALARAGVVARGAATRPEHLLLAVRHSVGQQGRLPELRDGLHQRRLAFNPTGGGP